MPTSRAKKRASSPPLAPPVRRSLHYKVVELSTVDEASLERTLNEWGERGWSFDGLQFAMRESSKRPSMAFVFFTREGAPIGELADVAEAPRQPKEAHAHLRRLANSSGARPDAWSRLQALALDDEGKDQ